MEVKVKNGKRKHLDTEEEWNCPHCTFLNTAKAFRCGACDIQRGTSTRRAGINPQIVQQQEMEQMLAKDRIRQQRAKARSHRSMSPSASLPSPSVASHSRYLDSPGTDSLDTSSAMSPSISGLGPAKRFPSPTASTSRLSETPSNASSYTPPEGLLFHGKSHRPVTLRPPVKKRKKGKRGKKAPGVGASNGEGVPAFRGRGTIFPIAHNGVELEFEEYIPSDVSVSEESDKESTSDS